MQDIQNTIHSDNSIENQTDRQEKASVEIRMENQIEKQIHEAEQETLAAVCPCCRKKDRSDAETKDLITRLNRIEGQIRGIRKMVESESYCIDILTQVSAASSALNSFTKVLLSSHIKTCVTDDIQNGSEEKLDELLRILPKLMK